MIVDVVGGLVVALAVWWGWRTGAIRQMTKLAAVVAMVVGVPFVSPWIKELVFGESGRATMQVEVGSMLMAGMLIFVTVAMAGYVMARMMHWMSAILGFLDRLGGATVGVVVGALMVYFLAVGMVFMEPEIEAWDPDNQYGLQGGTVTAVAGEYNFLGSWQFPDLRRLHRALMVSELAAEEGQEGMLREDGGAARVLRDERLRRLVEDEDFMAQVRAKRYPATLADGRTRDILNDPSLSEGLGDVEWRRLLRELERGGEAE